LIGGGGAAEIHVSRLLSQYAQSLKGMEAYCFQAYADALEVIPTTLAENAGLNPIAIVTELRNRHALGERNAGINVRKVRFPVHLHMSHLNESMLGIDIKYIGRGRRTAIVSFDKCHRTLNRNSLPAVKD
jgi:uncharacterized protein YcgL (UPF0745 family)